MSELREVRPGDHYAALGSSFAAGPGIEPIIDVAAARSGRNYAHLVAERLNLDLTDVTRSGAVTADVLQSHRQRPRFWRTVPPQIEAVRRDTRLVTLTIGGNDLGYIGGLIKASALSTAPGPVRRIGAALRLSADVDYLRTLEGRLTDVVTALRQRAPEARILLVEYLSVLAPDGPEAPSGAAQRPLTGKQRRAAVVVARMLSAIYAEVSDRTGAELVAAATASRGHAVGSADPWVSGYTGVRGGHVPYHPTADGMAAVADLILARLTDRPLPDSA